MAPVDQGPIGRNSRPGREASGLLRARLAGIAEQPRGLDLQRPDLGHTDGMVALLHRSHGKPGFSKRRLLSPIERRVGVEDLQAA